MAACGEVSASMPKSTVQAEPAACSWIPVGRTAAKKKEGATASGVDATWGAAEELAASVTAAAAAEAEILCCMHW